MQVRLRHVVTTIAFMTAAAPITAQEKTPADTGAKACDPNVVPSVALAKATFSMQRAFQHVQAKQPADSDLRVTIRTLSTPGPKKEEGDSLGRTYYLGQAYILMLQQPSVRPIGRRIEYGIVTDSLLTIDLLAAADTAFTTIERVWPACAPELAKWRQQQPWLDALNGAVAAVNTGKFDSAEVYAKRSLLIDRTTPYAYSVLGNVANNRKDFDAATNYYKQAMAIAEKDTLYNDVKINTIFDLANNATMRAEATTGADQKARVQEAVAAWQTFIPIGTRDSQIANAEQWIVRLLRSVGDSASAPQAYAQLLANPSHYNEQALQSAGVIATRAKQPQDAVKLFAAVLDKNPNQRDALSNLAASYVGMQDYEHMFPLVDRLVSLDPNNADSWLFYAYAYSGLLKGTKDPQLVKTYTDSLVKYNTKAEKLETHVLLTEFSHFQSKATIAGTIENRTPTPKSYTMQVEFLDTKGTTVATQTVNVGPIPGNSGNAPFSVSADASNVVAFRYKLQ